MKNTDVSDVERTLRQSLDITISVNDLRILVDCLRAMAYLGEADGEEYLDSDGRELKDRIESLYRVKLEDKGRWIHGASTLEPLEDLE